MSADVTAIIVVAEALVDAVTFDDSNGGLLSRETIRKNDMLRTLLLRWRKQNGK